MKTLLQIAKRDDGDIDIEMAQDENSLGYLYLALHRLSIKNVNFRALLCATFESLCKSHPEVYGELQDHLDNHSAEPTIAVKPNPTKS